MLDPVTKSVTGHRSRNESNRPPYR